MYPSNFDLPSSSNEPNPTVREQPQSIISDGNKYQSLINQNDSHHSSHDHNQSPISNYNIINKFMENNTPKLTKKDFKKDQSSICEEISPDTHEFERSSTRVTETLHVPSTEEFCLRRKKTFGQSNYYCKRKPKASPNIRNRSESVGDCPTCWFRPKSKLIREYLNHPLQQPTFLKTRLNILSKKIPTNQKK